MNLNIKTLALLCVLAMPTFFLTGVAAVKQLDLSREQAYTLPIRGYDPRDLVMGHYFQFQIDYGHPAFQSLPQAVQDVAAKPENGGSKRFYIDEADGPWLDAYFRKNAADFTVKAKIHGGRLHIQDLLIKGRPYRDVMRDHPDIVPAE